MSEDIRFKERMADGSCNGCTDRRILHVMIIGNTRLKLCSKCLNELGLQVELKLKGGKMR